ncbi:MAG: PilX N-terminal domain-containing pilus assembly protein [Patescibacteria group bacterium]
MILRLRSGQVLVVLLVFVAMATAVTGAAISMGIASLQSASNLSLGQSAYLLAESGLEKTLLQLLRNPDLAQNTLTTSAGIATIIVSGTDPKIIESVAQSGNFVRRIRVVAGYTNGILTIQSQHEY